jgi:hypothetical protein
MLAATVIGVLIVPALFVFIETISGRGKGGQGTPADTENQAESDAV